MYKKLPKNHMIVTSFCGKTQVKCTAYKMIGTCDAALRCHRCQSRCWVCSRTQIQLEIVNRTQGKNRTHRNGRTMVCFSSIALSGQQEDELLAAATCYQGQTNNLPASSTKESDAYRQPIVVRLCWRRSGES